MATHSSILAWKSPWTEEPGGLQSMGSRRVRRDLETEQKGLQRIFWVPLWTVLQILKPHQVEEVTYMMPDCSHDVSCHSSKNRPQRNGNKSTLDLKSNCTLNSQDDTGQNAEDQFQEDCQNWLCCFCLEPPPSAYKKSPWSLIVSAGVGGERGGNWPLDRHPTKPLPIVRIQNKATFPFSTNLASSLAFEQRAVRPHCRLYQSNQSKLNKWQGGRHLHMRRGTI